MHRRAVEFALSDAVQAGDGVGISYTRTGATYGLGAWRDKNLVATNNTL